MVNYRYELNDIERNHEAYVKDGTVVAARAVRSLLKAQSRPKGCRAFPTSLRFPGVSKTKKARRPASE